MYIHAIIADEVQRELCVSILFVYLQNYFEDLAFLVDVCKKKWISIICLQFYFLVIIWPVVFFYTTTPLCQKTGTMFDFWPLHYTLIWNLNGIWIGISDILIKQKKTFLCRILTIISYLLRRSCKHHGNRTTNRTNIAAEINKMHVDFSKHPRRFSCVWKIRLRLSYEITKFTKRTRRKCKYMYVKM